jgi:cytosine/uracil/thiamine/allantoin permease
VATPGGSVADPNFFDRVYAYAWFVTFGLSFFAYLVLMRGQIGRTPAAPTA